MIALEREQLAQALAADMPGGVRVTGLTTDSRSVSEGDAFVALQGRYAHGDRFIGDALQRGAALAIGSIQAPAGDPRIIRVRDPQAALIALGKAVRGRFKGPVMGITGSVGKTTLKEMLRHLLPPAPKTITPDQSHNNFEGVPLTLGRIEQSTERVILEFGTNAPGEIAGLCELGRPTMGVLTAIGESHLEKLGTVEGVLKEKRCLAEALPRGSRLYINQDDPILGAESWPSHLRVRRLGLFTDHEVVAPFRRQPGILVDDDGNEYRHHFGALVLERALWMALMIARDFGVSASALCSSTPGLSAPPLRGELRTLRGSTLVLDCYNANPLSMKAALAQLGRADGLKVAVLGQMLELGSFEDEAHRSMADQVVDAGVERCLFFGKSASVVRRALEHRGFDLANFHSLDSVEDEGARQLFHEVCRGAKTVLIKASRGMKLEELLRGGGR